MEGLLFRSFLTGYNLRLLHDCITSKHDDFDTPDFRLAALANTDKGFENKVSVAMTDPERTLKAFHKNGWQIIPHFHGNYPKPLLAAKRFPLLLFVSGVLNSQKLAAVVGSRIVSPLAESKVADISRCLQTAGYGIISGLAHGIDTLAHTAAVRRGIYTVAVLPTELGRIFPKENLDLAKGIVNQGGALVTEQPPGTEPMASHFVLRNRIIAALANPIIPVEMVKDSGTAHTIKYACRYGKKIILCKPTAADLDRYLSYYEGIVQALGKLKRRKANVELLSCWRELDERLDKNKQRQPELF